MVCIPLDILNNLDSLLGNNCHVPAAEGMFSEKFLFPASQSMKERYVCIYRGSVLTARSDHDIYTVNSAVTLRGFSHLKLFSV